jgi:hypothetical protein
MLCRVAFIRELKRLVCSFSVLNNISYLTKSEYSIDSYVILRRHFSYMLFTGRWEIIMNSELVRTWKGAETICLKVSYYPRLSEGG